MSERAPYSRVYWSIVDDEKFVTVYDNDAHLAAWLRLLLIADQAHPASAHLPTNVRKASVKALANVGLIDVTGGRYRVRGLDAERRRRRDAATTGPTRDPNGTPTGSKRDPSGTQTVPHVRAYDAPARLGSARLVSDSASSTGGAGGNDPWADPEWEAIAWLGKHGCDIRPGNGYHQKLVTAVERHGINALIGKLDRLAEAGVKDGDIKGFLFGAIDALDSATRPSLKALEAEDRAEERESDHQRRLERTRRETAELRAVLDRDSA